jgi:hypothetical protein
MQTVKLCMYLVEYLSSLALNTVCCRGAIVPGHECLSGSNTYARYGFNCAI